MTLSGKSVKGKTLCYNEPPCNCPVVMTRREVLEYEYKKGDGYFLVAAKRLAEQSPEKDGAVQQCSCWARR